VNAAVTELLGDTDREDRTNGHLTAFPFTLKRKIVIFKSLTFPEREHRTSFINKARCEAKPLTEPSLFPFYTGPLASNLGQVITVNRCQNLC
jgi:hypothetical protein